MNPRYIGRRIDFAVAAMMKKRLFVICTINSLLFLDGFSKVAVTFRAISTSNLPTWTKFHLQCQKMYHQIWWTFLASFPPSAMQHLAFTYSCCFSSTQSAKSDKHRKVSV
jgi:hypothetical protein